MAKKSTKKTSRPSKSKTTGLSPSPEAPAQEKSSHIPGMPTGQHAPGMPGQQIPGMPSGQYIPGMPGQQIPGMPSGQHVPGMPGQQVPGMPSAHQVSATPSVAPPGHFNPMAQMMQMMQMMMGPVSGVAGIDPAAQPFTQVQATEDDDPGLEADVIRPHALRGVVKIQEALPVGGVLDRLCLTEDRQYSLGGLPKGCTIAFAGPPGQGKTRSAIAALCHVAAAGTRVAFVVAEEGFIDQEDSGRDDLCSRLTKIGMKTLGLSAAQFQKKVAPQMAIIQSQYHKGHSWDDFVTKYRYVIENEAVKFVVIDSLNTLDPSKTRTADNLAALKTYNHEKGITCLTIGQIRDSGMPVGGEALMHTADAVFLLEELILSSKDQAAFWQGKYRDRILVIRAIKSVTTPVFPHPIRVIRDEHTGVLSIHPNQPQEYTPLPIKEASD